MTSQEPNVEVAAPVPPAEKICAILQWTSLAVAIALGVALSWRTITGADIGCHLTYGEHLLDTGEIIDSNMFIYTDVTPTGDHGMDFAPSSWIDDAGRLRFPNVNWLSQWIMAIAHRAGGPTGVCLLQSILVAVLMGLASITMLRAGAKPWIAAAGVAIMALTVQARFMHRPELFGFVIMAAQLAILIRPRIGKYSVIGLVLLQAAFVQLHSSWMLGLFLTGCFLADRSLRSLWSHFRTPDQPLPCAGQWKLLAAALAAQIAVAFASPWGWRTAFLPLQMMQYLKANQLIPAGQKGVTHPWSTIREMYPSLSPIFAYSVTSAAFMASLIVAAVAAVCAAWTRRWSYLLLLIGAAWMSLQIRRNIGPGAVILAPAAIAAIAAGGMKLPESWRRQRVIGQYAPAAASGGIVIACVVFIFFVVTNRLYYSQGIGPRFGAGVSKVDIPVEAGEYLKTLPDDAKVFTTFDLASNVLYFGRGETGYRQVPVLGNGWACPPRNMDLVRLIAESKKPLGPFARRYGIDAVVLKVNAKSAYLIKLLFLSPQWRLRSLGARTVVFATVSVDSSPPPIAEANTFITKLEAMDPIPIYPLQAAARTLQYIEWYDLAIKVGQRAVETDPDYKGVWIVLGSSHALRAKALRAYGDSSFKADILEARRCFAEALKHQSVEWDALGKNYALLAADSRAVDIPGAIGDLQKAQECFTKAQENAPHSAEISRRLLQVQRNLDQLRKIIPSRR